MVVGLDGYMVGYTTAVVLLPVERCTSICLNISGPSRSDYTPSAGDVGAKLRVLVTATNSAGSATAVSGLVGPVVPSARQIKSWLLRVLSPSRKAKIGDLLKKRAYSSFFRALSAGRVVIDWYYVPKGAKISKAKTKPKPLLVASGKADFSKDPRQDHDQARYPRQADPQTRQQTPADREGDLHPDRECRRDRDEDVHAEAISHASGDQPRWTPQISRASRLPRVRNSWPAISISLAVATGQPLGRDACRSLPSAPACCRIPLIQKSEVS